MRRVFFGGVLVGLFALVGVWVTAASGDVVWVEASGIEPKVLSGAQKTYLGSTINAAFGTEAGALSGIKCHLSNPVSGNWTCRLKVDVTLTDQQYFVARKNGEISAGASTVTKTASFPMPEDHHDEFSTLTSSVFGLALDELYVFSFDRDPVTPTTVYGDYQKLAVGSPALHRERDVGGFVLLQIGVVD